MDSHTSCGTDENISATKIQPLDSPTKAHVPHAQGEGGVAGTDDDIDHSRIEPLGGHGETPVGWFADPTPSKPLGALGWS